MADKEEFDNEVTKVEDQKPTASKVEKSVKLRLTGSHTHEGISYTAGEFIEVDEQSAKYIVEQAKTGVRV